MPEDQGYEDTIEVLADVFKLGMTGSWSSKGSDEKVTLPITPTTSGGFSPQSTAFSASAFSRTFHSDTATSACNVMTFAKSVDKQFAQVYERRIQAMVKEEQKKALRRVK